MLLLTAANTVLAYVARTPLPVLAPHRSERVPARRVHPLRARAIVAAHASVLGSRELLEELERLVCAADSDADWLRARRSE
jgi:hypothetical protein